MIGTEGQTREREGWREGGRGRGKKGEREGANRSWRVEPLVAAYRESAYFIVAIDADFSNYVWCTVPCLRTIQPHSDSYMGLYIRSEKKSA